MKDVALPAAERCSQKYNVGGCGGTASLSGKRLLTPLTDLGTKIHLVMKKILKNTVFFRLNMLLHNSNPTC